MWFFIFINVLKIAKQFKNLNFFKTTKIILNFAFIKTAIF
jgi:hypothetical protein